MKNLASGAVFPASSMCQRPMGISQKNLAPDAVFPASCMCQRLIRVFLQLDSGQSLLKRSDSKFFRTSGVSIDLEDSTLLQF